MRRWSEIDAQHAIEMLKNGKSYAEISKDLHRSSKSVKVYLQKHGLTFRSFNPSRETRKCLYCTSEFVETIHGEKKFCNQSCAASFNNRIFIKRKKIVRAKHIGKVNVGICMNKECGCDVDYNKKYCSNTCFQTARRNERDAMIESGNANLPSNAYRRYLIRKHGEKCMDCGWDKKHPTTGRVPIELEHVDGNSNNHSLKNLKLLCPNCHSLTLTYKALNKGNGRHKRMERYAVGKSY